MTEAMRMKLEDLRDQGQDCKLSADDGGRGKEVTITGSGFNNGVSAEAFVLSKVEIAKWWESLGCAGMKEAMGSDSNGFCFHFDKKTGDLSDTAMHHADFTGLDESMQDVLRRHGALPRCDQRREITGYGKRGQRRRVLHGLHRPPGRVRCGQCELHLR